MERLPEGNRPDALDVLSESQSANASVLKRVRRLKQLAIGNVCQATNRLDRRLGVRSI